MHKLAVALSLSALFLSSIVGVAQSAPVVQRDYGKLPLSFEANQGQTDPQVRFTSRGSGYSLFLTDSAAVLSLSKSEGKVRREGLADISAAKAGAASMPAKGDVIRMELVGANPKARVEGTDSLPGKSNYFIGNDPSKWHTDVPTYSKVKYASVYPGIDLIY